MDAAATQCSGAQKKEFSTCSHTLESTSESEVSSTETLKHSQVLWKHKHVMLKHRFQRNTLEALQPHFRITEKIKYYYSTIIVLWREALHPYFEARKKSTDAVPLSFGGNVLAMPLALFRLLQLSR